MTQTFDQNWIIQDTQMIIRPPRSPYNIKKIKQQLDVAYELKENQSYEFLNFQNKKGQDITGTLFIPENPKEGNPCVVFAHGNSTNQMFPAFPYAHYFYEEGIYVFTFDFPGTANSKEMYITFGYNEPHTILDVCDWLQSNKNIGKISLFGHSMGGFSSLFAMSIDHRFSSAAIFTPYTSIYDFLKIHNFLKGRGDFEEYAKEVSKKVQEKAGFDFYEADLSSHLKDITTPTCILHCDMDQVCPNWMAKKIFQNLPVEDKLEIGDPDGDHSYFDEELVKKAVDFIIRHIES